MNNFLVAVAVLLIAVLAAAFAVPRVVHWENYRGIIEEEATRLLGRDVRVGGRVTIQLLPSPTFSVGQIRIADTEANTGEPFFQAESLSGRLAITPLLRGVFQASEMVLTKPLLHLVLDGDGGGNWKTLGQGSGQLPFQFSEVALDSVKIEGGSLGIFGADRAERLRLDAIDGILSAQAMDGPFRFRGFFGIDPVRRELRLSTNKQEADGSLRFKATLRQLDSGSVFNFDARAVDLARSPRLEGELVATVPLPQLTGPQAGTQPAGATKAESEAPVEVKAALSADLKLVKLANLSLAFERMGRPQILTGEAQIDLSRNVVVTGQIAAKWLDLDQMIGTAPLPGQEAGFKPARGPVEGLLTLAQRLNGFTPDQGQARLVLDVEQANLGREPVSGLRLSVNSAGAETDIRELRLGLPGGAQADVKGLMTGSGEETSFSGDIVLRGASLVRFLGWATAGSVVLDPARDGAFAMRSKLITAPGSVVAREFTGELAGTIMQGELGYRWQGRPEVSVLIEGPRVDLRTVLGGAGGNQKMASLANYIAAGSSFGAQAGSMDAVLRVRAGELLVPGGAFIDAVADLELRAGRVRVSQLRLAGDHGVTLDVDGDMPIAASAQRGTLRGTVSAATAPGIQNLADLLGIPAAVRPDSARFGQLAPLRMAGAVSFSAAEASPLEIAVDGHVAGSQVTAKGRFDKGIATWQSAPLDLAFTSRGARSLELAQSFTRSFIGVDSVKTAPSAPLSGETTLVVHVAGTPRESLITQAALADQQPRLQFTGTTVLSERHGLAATGALAFRQADLASTLSFLVPTYRASMPALSLTGRANLETAENGTLKLDQIDARIGDVTVAGQLSRNSDEGRITGRIRASEVPATALLQPLQGARSQPRTGALWPVALFEDGAGIPLADIEIATARLNLPGGIGLHNATFKLALAPGRVEIRDLDGSGAGGTWSGAGKLEQAKEGASFTGVLRLKDLQLASLKSSGQKRAALDGAASGLVTFSGRGASAHDLVQSLAGRGNLALSDSNLALLSPPHLAAILQTALRAPQEAIASSLRQQLTGFAPQSTTAVLPARAIEIDLKNGLAALSPVGLESPDGKMLGALSIDLSSLSLSGSWRVDTTADVLPPQPGWTTSISPTGAPVPRKLPAPLPPVVTTLTAPLASLGAATIEVSTEALEREVAVRKVERDLEDLERLRKLDEDRAKEEVERRRAIENGALPTVPGAQPAGVDTTLQATNPDASTEPTVVPDSVDPSTRPKPAAAPPPASQPAPKPALQPVSPDERRRIFGGVGGG